MRNTRLSLLLGLITILLTACPGTSLKPPVADAGADQTVAVGAQVTLDGSGSSGADVRFTWTFEGKPEGSQAELSGADAFAATFVADQAGEYLVRLTVHAGGQSADDTVVITATPSGNVGGTLEPGQTYIGEDEVVLGALNSTLEARLGVDIRRADAPEVPLPKSAQRRGEFYRLSALRDTFGMGNPFVVALPVSEGADTSSLALALLLQPEDVVETDLKEPTWHLLEGIYDPENNYFVTTLPFLAAEGRVVVLVEAAGFTSPNLSKTPTLTPQQTSGEFLVSCRTFDDDINNRDLSCSTTNEEDLQTALEDAYADFTGLGFAEPYLQRRIDVTASSFNPNNATIVFAEYLAELRPLRDVGADEDRWPCGESPDGITNLGGYSSASQSFFVCIGTNGVNNRAVETGRHEYFHATQYGYAKVRDNPREKWITEGTAVVSEDSLDTMMRDTSRSLHQVDIPLTASGDPELIEYLAQDFFIYTGLVLGRGVDYLIDVFKGGARTADVDSALTTLSGGDGLGAFYWAWAKNQSFEKAVDIGGGVLGSPCTLDSQIADDLKAISFNSASAATNQTYTLDPLTSRVIRFDFERFDAGDYHAEITIPLSNSDLHVKFYDAADAGTTDCQSGLELPQELVMVKAGESARRYALVANTSLTQTRNVTISVTGEPSLTINAPTINPATGGMSFKNGESLIFQATATGFESGDLLNIYWSYENSDGIPFAFATSKSGESFTFALPCIDTIITAEALDARTSQNVKRRFSASCIPKEETFFLNARKAHGGMVTSNGKVVPGDMTLELHIGDDALNSGKQGMLHFDLSTLPGTLVNIKEAELTVFFDPPVNSPLTDLSYVRVVHVDYGDTLDIGDYRTKGGATFLPGAATIASIEPGSHKVDITTAVKNAWDNRETRGDKVQFALYSDPETDNDDEAEFYRVVYEDRPGTLLLPALEVTFENY